MYTRLHDKIKILCEEHGVFEKNLSDHISPRKPQGCKQCSLREQSKKAKIFYDVEQIRKIGKEVFNDFYTYPDQPEVTAKEKILIICPVHGEYRQVLHSHMKGMHCNKCSYNSRAKERAKPVEVFIKESNSLHNSKFDYSKFVYVNSRTAGEIKCTECSFVFNMTPQLHLTHGLDCPNCSVIDSNPVNIYSKAIKGGMNYDECPCSLYVVELYDHAEKFIKVGITTNSINKRFSKCPYNFKVHHVIDTSLSDALKQEKVILNSFKDLKYNPTKSFSGYTECLDITSLSDIQNVLLARNGQRVSSLIAGTP